MIHELARTIVDVAIVAFFGAIGIYGLLLLITAGIGWLKEAHRKKRKK